MAIMMTCIANFILLNVTCTIAPFKFHFNGRTSSINCLIPMELDGHGREDSREDRSTDWRKREFGDQEKHPFERYVFLSEWFTC